MFCDGNIFQTHDLILFRFQNSFDIRIETAKTCLVTSCQLGSVKFPRPQTRIPFKNEQKNTRSPLTWSMRFRSNEMSCFPKFCNQSFVCVAIYHGVQMDLFKVIWILISGSKRRIQWSRMHPTWSKVVKYFLIWFPNLFPKYFLIDFLMIS